MKRKKTVCPEVHILGDMQDVKSLVSAVNRKKSVVIFKDGDHGTYYVEIEGKFRLVSEDDLTFLDERYRLITFTFFPSLKPAEPITSSDEPVIPGEEVEKPVKGTKKVKKETKEGKEQKDKKEKKQKKEKRKKKNSKR